MSPSKQTHKRDKTESFEGTQMAFEFPNSSCSELRDSGSCSDGSSGIYDNNNFHHLTNISISSSIGNTLRTTELFGPLDNATSLDHTKSKSFKSKYTASVLSVKVKNQSINSRKRSSSIRRSNRSNRVQQQTHRTSIATGTNKNNSLTRSPTIRSLNQYLSRSPSVLSFNTTPLNAETAFTIPSLRKTQTLSSLKRSNAVKHKEGWLSRLIRIFKLRLQKWRRIVRKKSFNNKVAPSMTSMSRSNSLVRSASKISKITAPQPKPTPTPLPATFKTTKDLQLTQGKSAPLSDQLDAFIEEEEQLMNLENMSQVILQQDSEKINNFERKEYPTPTMEVENSMRRTISYPDPTVDVSYNDTNTTANTNTHLPVNETVSEKEVTDQSLEDIYRLWSHYLRQTVMSRIQLKLDINEFRETGENKRESVLESIIFDYVSDYDDDEKDDYEDEDDESSDELSFVSSLDGDERYNSSATSLSSYSSLDVESDIDSIQDSIRQSIITSSGVLQDGEMSDDDLSDYQSSYYPTRENSLISRNRSMNIKRNNSMMVKRMLTIQSEVSSNLSSNNSNLTYIEDFVTIKNSKVPVQTAVSAGDRFALNLGYSYSNPYLEQPKSGLTRSPSFVISKNFNTLMSVKE